MNRWAWKVQEKVYDLIKERKTTDGKSIMIPKSSTITIHTNSQVTSHSIVSHIMLF